MLLVIKATAGNLVGPQGDDCEDAQGPHVKAEEAQPTSREAVALHMGEAHRSKLHVADSLGSDGADCGQCGRDVSSCTCDFGVIKTAKVVQFEPKETLTTQLQDALWDVISNEKFEELRAVQTVGVLEYLKWNIINRS